MNPYAGTIAGYSIPYFAIALDAGIVVGVAVMVLLARRRGVAVTATLDVAFAALLGALVGARLWYVVVHSADYVSGATAIVAVWEGGLALPGAVLGGIVAGAASARLLRAPLAVLGDAGAIGAALAEAIARPGCLPSGCAAGREASGAWMAVALNLPDATSTVADRVPSQILEAAAAALLGIVLFLVWRTRPAAGTVALLFLAGAGTLRVVFEPLRADSTLVAGVPLAMWWGGLVSAVGVVMLLVTRRWRSVSG